MTEPSASTPSLPPHPSLTTHPSVGTTQPSANTRFQREIDFYGFDPVSFIDDVINCVEDYACDGLDAMERAVTKLNSFKTSFKTGPGTTRPPGEAGRSLDRLLEELSRSMNKNLDLFELYALQNILSVPSDLAVARLKAAETPVEAPPRVAQAHLDAMDSELAALRSRLSAAKRTNRALHAEAARVGGQLDAVSALRCALELKEDDALFGPGVPDLPNTLQALCTQSQALAAEVVRLQGAAGAAGAAQGPAEDVLMVEQGDRTGRAGVSADTAQLLGFVAR